MWIPGLSYSVGTKSDLILNLKNIRFLLSVYYPRNRIFLNSFNHATYIIYKTILSSFKVFLLFHNLGNHCFHHYMVYFSKEESAQRGVG